MKLVDQQVPKQNTCALTGTQSAGHTQEKKEEGGKKKIKK